MNIAEKAVLITGANRGIGKALVKEASADKVSCHNRRPAPPTPEEMRAFFGTVAKYGYWMASPEENAAIGIRL